MDSKVKKLQKELEEQARHPSASLCVPLHPSASLCAPLHAQLPPPFCPHMHDTACSRVLMRERPPALVPPGADPHQRPAAGRQQRPPGGAADQGGRDQQPQGRDWQSGEGERATVPVRHGDSEVESHGDSVAGKVVVEP